MTLWGRKLFEADPWEVVLLFATQSCENIRGSFLVIQDFWIAVTVPNFFEILMENRFFANLIF